MTPLTDSVMLDGVLLRREAIALGVSDKKLHQLTREKFLARIRQGVYAEADRWNRADAEQRHVLLTSAVVRLYGPDTLVSHVSGAVEHGIPSWGLDLRHVHISYPGANGRTNAAVHHHDADRQPDDLPRALGGWVRHPARAVVEAVIAMNSVEIGVCMTSYLLRKKLTCSEQLWRLHDEHRDHSGSLRLRTALALADGRLESVGEARLWYLLKRAGLPDVIPQYQVYDMRGRPFARVDFVIPELGIIIEFDGLEKYVKFLRPGESVADLISRERGREAEVERITGYRIVRFLWADLAHPERILAAARHQARA